MCLTEDLPFLSKTRCDFTRAMVKSIGTISMCYTTPGSCLNPSSMKNESLNALGQRLGGD